MEGVSGCKIFMNSFSEGYLLGRGLSDGDFLILDALLNILPHLIVLFDVFGCKHTVFVFTWSYVALVLLGNLFDDLILVLLESFLLLFDPFLSLLLL